MVVVVAVAAAQALEAAQEAAVILVVASTTVLGPVRALSGTVGGRGLVARTLEFVDGVVV